MSLAPIEVLRRALAEIPALDDRIRRTKSFMGSGGSPPRVQLADWLDDVQTAMAAIAPTLSDTCVLARVKGVGQTVTLQLLDAHPVASHHTGYADFIGQVWSFTPAGDRALTAGPALAAIARSHAGSGLPVLATLDGGALVGLQ